MAIVYLNIGSNIGNRRALIEKAIRLISEKFGFYCLSEFVESDPWGFDSTNRFLNVGMAIKTDLHPEKILSEMQAIEKRLSSIAHRDASGNYKDRELDIDIMAIDELEYKSKRLQLPHPHLMDREFFIGLLLQLAPEWCHPGLCRSQV
ncbi:MAG: 2-amino-4-hydroxy-6-hydroxymethyldihydropteridine diphosphokinase [Muribaculaceae bacterium]|nr:2-amino-4-hydroxy-6-hydroxymethyldihydropteridine diphosphokinase [Muribaculaceae bacterium]